MVARNIAISALTLCLRALAWVGTHARWGLAFGLVLALVFQELCAWMRPALAPLVAVTLGLAFLRIEPRTLSYSFGSLRKIAELCGLHAVLAIVTPVALFFAMSAVGTDTQLREMAVYTYLAPPIASSAALALLLGFNARLTLALTLFSGLLAPVTAPLIASLLFEATLPVDPLSLGLRLGLITAAGAAIAAMGRAALGAGAIEANKLPLDGLAALTMFAMIFPLFDGARAAIFAAPVFASSILLLALVLNFGLQAIVARISGRISDGKTARALGLIAGNRNAALFLAALPESAGYSLFVALYQVPMYLTPLLAPWVLRQRKNDDKSQTQ